VSRLSMAVLGGIIFGGGFIIGWALYWRGGIVIPCPKVLLFFLCSAAKPPNNFFDFAKKTQNAILQAKHLKNLVFLVAKYHVFSTRLFLVENPCLWLYNGGGRYSLPNVLPFFSCLAAKPLNNLFGFRKNLKT